MTLADRIRNMVEVVPEDGAVTIPVRTLQEWLEHEEAVQGDLSLEEWARALAPHDPPAVSTVREWFAAGLVPGAYKRNGRKWMAPRSSVGAFRALQQERHGGGRPERPAQAQPALGRGRRRQPNLAAWRDY